MVIILLSESAGNGPKRLCRKAFCISGAYSHSIKASAGSSAVIVQRVSKSFGNENVLKEVSLGLEKGKIHGIIGRNGSGKTVLMKCICGFLRPTSGAVKVFDKIIGTDCDFDF